MSETLRRLRSLNFGELIGFEMEDPGSYSFGEYMERGRRHHPNPPYS